MTSIFDGIGVPAASVWIPGGHELVMFPDDDTNEDDTSGLLGRCYVVRLPQPGELETLLGALSLAGMIEYFDGNVAVLRAKQKMAQFPPRLLELFLLVMNNAEVAQEFSLIAQRGTVALN